MNIKVGQFNTGCENKVKQRLEAILPADLDEILGGSVSVTVSHAAQPHFNNIGVVFNVSLGGDRHFQNSFAVTMDDVRNLSTPDLDGRLQNESRATLAELKALMDKVLTP